MKVVKQHEPDENGVVRVDFDCGCCYDFDSPDDASAAAICDEHSREHRRSPRDHERQAIFARSAWVAADPLKTERTPR